MGTATQQLAFDVETRGHEKRRPTTVSPALVRQMETWGATELFDLYWYFACARQDLYLRRLAGAQPPWTSDLILRQHRFTNPYRFSDRVSQYLLQRVQYNRQWPSHDLIFRTLLFKIFNRIDTWESLVATFGEPCVDSFVPGEYSALLGDLMKRGSRIYSAAYIVPNPPLGSAVKHENHLALLGTLLNDGTIEAISGACDLAELYRILRNVPSFGPFLAFQYAVDINYSTVTASDESGFVVAGPGARSGLAKCFLSLPKSAFEDALLWVAATQEDHFDRMGLHFNKIAERPLQPIDCQNLFCELDKYSRVSHPSATERGGRTRIKQKFADAGRPPLPLLFIPPKWSSRVMPENQFESRP